MKVSIKNLGKIDNCDLELNNLTILVGDNNSGKTYVTYSTYGALKYWKDFIHFDSFKEFSQEIILNGQINLNKDEIFKLSKEALKKESTKFKKRIKELFNDKEKLFDEASLEIEVKNPTTYIDRERKVWIGDNTVIEGIISDDNLKITYTSSSKSVIEKEIVNEIIGELFCSLVFENAIPHPTIITAERLGISLFYKELDERRNSMIESLQNLENKNSMHPFELIMNMSAYYATPIRDHIAFTRNLDNIKKNSSDLDISYSLEIIKEILGAEFKKENKQDIRFYTKNKRSNRFDIPLYLASSSARCIVDIFFYLKHIAQVGDLLIIDEPESHFTLKNQRLMAKLIASMINLGIKVFITTHSDFLIKELNNLILLNNEFEEKKEWLMKNKKRYTNKDFLDYKYISVYQGVNGTLNSLEISNSGIEIPFFDEEINNLFTISSDLDYFIS
nr:AAA family ATPase [uncultured Empedobacter sp.]